MYLSKSIDQNLTRHILFLCATEVHCCLKKGITELSCCPEMFPHCIEQMDTVDFHLALSILG